MARLILQRLVSLVCVLLALSIVVFLIRAVLPADPVRAMVGVTAPTEVVERKREELGFNDPLAAQYVRFLGQAVRGDLGMSLRTRRPVTDDIAKFAPATLELAAVTVVVAGMMAIAFGLWSALGEKGSGAARVLMVGGASAPTFFLAIVMMLVFYQRLGWLPSSGRLGAEYSPQGPTGFLLVDSVLQLDAGKLFDALHHLVIPTVCLALAPAVAVGRVLRGSLQDVLRQDFIRTARSKGLREVEVIIRHGLRNAIGPALSMGGLQVGALLAGVVVVEQVMAWPGLGRYTTQAITVADFPAVTGVTLVLGASYVLINAVVDIFQLVADPRLRSAEVKT